MQETKFITHFFPNLCKEIAQLLFWVIWPCLATQTWNDSILLNKPKRLSAGKK